MTINGYFTLNSSLRFDEKFTVWNVSILLLTICVTQDRRPNAHSCMHRNYEYSDCSAGPEQVAYSSTASAKRVVLQNEHKMPKF